MMNKKAIKLFAAILAILLCVALLPCAFAENTLTAQVSSVTGAPGDSVRVKIDINNNPGLTSLKFSIGYDNVLTLKKVEFNSEFGDMVTAKEPYENPQILSFISPFKAVAHSGTFAILTFKISEEAADKYEANVSLSYSADDIINGNDEIIPIIVSDGKITVLEECQHKNAYEEKGKEPTCLVPGLTAGLFCPDCNTWLIPQKEIKATGHKYNSRVTTQPTCTEDGVMTFTCQNDSSHTYTETISKKGHYFEEKFVSQPSCLTDGYAEYVCARCPASYSETLKATGHSPSSPVKENENPATCTGKGSYDEVVYCTVDNVEISRKTVISQLLPHNERVETISATLTANGKIETKCTICGKVSKTTTIYSPKTFSLSATKFTYTGKAIKPTVTVKDSKGNKIASSNYTVSYSNNTNAGTGKVTIKFKGNYSGTKTLNFTITPKQVTGLKVSDEKTTSLKLSWSKTAGAKYYKVERSTDGKKWTTLTTTSSTSYTANKLTAGKKYQFRVTALDSTKKIAGKASSVLKTGTLTSVPTLTLKSTKSKTATASWKKVAGASKYVVYKSTNGKKWTKVTTTTKTSYNLTKLTGGKKIYVKVTALNAYSKASAYSSTKNVTVKK